MSSDFLYILKWWFFIFGIGLLFFPISKLIFSRFIDKGYIFSKTLGIVVVSYLIFLFGTFHILPFYRYSIFMILIAIAIFDYFLVKKYKIKFFTEGFGFFVLQEFLFFVSLAFWSYVKAFQPEIHGLEKFMDYGFMNSILRSDFFPPTDMWFPPHSINYYYFGHLTTAILIKLTNIPASVSYNLMLSTIFAFTVTSAFSIVATLSQNVMKKARTVILSGLLGGIITSLGGNLQTIYSFFVAYIPPENPVPFWQLKFAPQTFPNGYWYPNATRFVPFTIHEFPSYSFVVSDLHGHVLDIPFVFLTIALILSIFLAKKLDIKITVLVSFMLAVMYMTNAWDGIIYFLLFSLTVLLWKSDILKVKSTAKKVRWFALISKIKNIKNKTVYLLNTLKYIIAAGFGYMIFSLPFSLYFKPFVSGIGVLCAPSFLTKLGRFGPLLFEADHCQRSPFWMLVILYGFFYFFAITLVIKIIRIKNPNPAMIFSLLLILLSTILIATPEFIYAKDIYPAHYRANTMFKLGYQAFIMLSMISSFTIAYLLNHGRKIIWIPPILILLIFILMYPYFAVNSYFNGLKEYKGLDGISYLKTLYPEDHKAILWIQENISGQPVIAEAQGDSYTDYERISANTGLPTIVGWTVHEWLWRGDYSYPQKRLDDAKNIYEGSLDEMKRIIKKYNVSYIYLGGLEKTKHPNIDEAKLYQLGKVVYQEGNTKIFEVNVP